MRYNLSINDSIAEIIAKEAESAKTTDLEIIRRTIDEKYGAVLSTSLETFRLMFLKDFRSDMIKIISVGQRIFLVVSDADVSDMFQKLKIIEIPEQLSWIIEDQNICLDRSKLLTVLYIGNNEYLLSLFDREKIKNLIPELRHEWLSRISLEKDNKFSIINGETIKALFNVRGGNA